MNSCYYYCGFKLDTALEFPELRHLESDEIEFRTISIRTGKVSIPTSNEFYSGPNWAIGPNESYWWLDGVLRSRITLEGVTIDASRRVSAGLVRALILEAPMIMAMQYHDAFCLAVSAVTEGNSVRAFRFLPGGGSSTAAGWQIRYGDNYTLVSDTLLMVSLGAQDQPLAWPQGSGLLLWPKSRSLLKLEDFPMLEVRSELPLRRVMLPSADRALPLGKIETAAMYRRIRQSLQEDTNLLKARKPFRFAALRTAGRLWIDPMGRSEEHFRWCLAIAKNSKIEKASHDNLYSQEG